MWWVVTEVKIASRSWITGTKWERMHNCCMWEWGSPEKVFCFWWKWNDSLVCIEKLLFPVGFEAGDAAPSSKGCDSPLVVPKLKSSYPWAEELGIRNSYDARSTWMLSEVLLKLLLLVDLIPLIWASTGTENISLFPVRYFISHQ